MSSPPTYIYKIVPSSETVPEPLPAALPISELDSRDNYIHASTSAQVLTTLNKFFSGADSIYLLRIPYAGVKDVVKWETTQGQAGAPGQEGCFPHLYNGLKVGKDEVDQVGTWKRGEGSWGKEGWPFGSVDSPP